ncbi:MAG: hypothetical protein JO199_13610, partial [Candidatus Eremiobacteraeota bacterium]|nr:hypothetical protein [Candidatus Eremiobacteraeota bacterium]
SPSPTPSPTPTPSTSPSTSPTPSTTPSPTPTPVNIRPTFTFFGPNTGIVTPTGVDVDPSGNIYVSDEGQLGHQYEASILVFAKPKVKGNGNVLNVKPIRTIKGKNTQLTTPTDVKVNASAGLIYVADSKNVLVFSITANGNTAPLMTYTSPGALTGLGIVPPPSPSASP